jgi:hypothetical protein
LIAIPKPVVSVRIVERRDTEGKSTNPKAIPIPALNSKDMAWAEAAGKPPMLKGMVQVKAMIVPPGIMTYPRAVRVNVWSLRMFFAIAEPAVNSGFLSRLWCSAVFRPRGRGAMRRNVSAADRTLFGPALLLFGPALLRKRGNRQHQKHRKNSDQSHITVSLVLLPRVGYNRGLGSRINGTTRRTKQCLADFGRNRTGCNLQGTPGVAAVAGKFHCIGGIMAVLAAILAAFRYDAITGRMGAFLHF